MLAKLRPFQHHDRVSIHDLETTFVREPDHACKEIEAICIFPLWIIVGKVNAEIALGHCAQNGVSHCVAQRVGI